MIQWTVKDYTKSSGIFKHWDTYLAKATWLMNINQCLPIELVLPNLTSYILQKEIESL